MDKDAGRPKGAPRMPENIEPTIPPGRIPGAPEPLPDTMEYDAAKQRLIVGNGYVAKVSQAMWDYEVSGKQVLWHWFSYRKRDRSRPISATGGRLAARQAAAGSWLPEYTTDLLDVLRVLGRLIALEPEQADLLARICAGPLRSAEELHAAGALATYEVVSAKPMAKSKS